MPLKSNEKAAALDFARRALSNRAARADAPTERAQGVAAGPAPTPAPRIEDLPQFKQIETMRAFSRVVAVENPFFRSHDARAGATTVMDGRRLMNFSAYDYLGLNGDARVIAAAKAGLDRYGVSASASRLVAGERPIHAELERELAAFHGVEAALAFVSGHATNVSTIAALTGPRDLIVTDQFAHNSIIVGAQLSGATRRMFPHNDADALRDILSKERDKYDKALVVVEGVYSMDGDRVDLPAILDAKEAYGAWLMLDEAHSVGVLGETGRGAVEAFGVDPARVDILMGTLGKSLASCGGYIAGSTALIDLLRYTAPGFVYSVGIPPAIAAAALEALRILIAEPERAAACRRAGRRFVEKARAAGLDTGLSEGYAVAPIMTGSSLAAVELSHRLYALGLNAQPILHPAVAENQARVRFFLTAEHDDAMIDAAVTLAAEAWATLETGSARLAGLTPQA